ncbi:ABC transporter ATP-binding protein [Maridesulfovibrio sp.]|uniref:ABC transporter ATP-binding protein n=1 Tax=Maridesulfovibrio sp. TaxID=2795000 RepID=UPI0029F4F20B|nr:ABC transporter ATP-binding protein [Maridesulfovibrio sp.]
MSLIEIRDLTKTYMFGGQKINAVSNLHLNIEEQEFVVLAGPSGSGKTTLLNLIGGLDQPTQGTLCIAGCRIDRMTPKALADFRLRSIGFIFQAHNLIPVLTAAENAEYVLLLQKAPKKTRREIVDSLFAELGIDGLQDRLPKDLSGGQQQRVAIARALASEPALILADEPTASLDSKASADLLELLLVLNKTKGISIVASSHDPMVMKYSKRTVFLQDGRLKNG